MCYLSSIMIFGAYCVGMAHNMLPQYCYYNCVGKVDNMLPWWYYDNGSILCR